MEGREIFIKIKNYVESQGFTIAQINNATLSQVANALNLSEDELEEYGLYESGIKKILIDKINKASDVQLLIDLKSQIHSWLVLKFPDYTVEKDFSNKLNRKITFHLDGND